MIPPNSVVTGTDAKVDHPWEIFSFDREIILVLLL